MDINFKFQGLPPAFKSNDMKIGASVVNLGNSLNAGITLDKSDKLDLSNLSQIAYKAITLLKNAIIEIRNDEPVTKSKERVISDDYVQSIIDLGKAVSKPDEKIDDLQWGLMVQMGMETGISDPSILPELTTADLDNYIDEFHNKLLWLKAVEYDILDENGSIVQPKMYDNKTDYWSDVFKTDGSGNVVRDNSGNPLRNLDFTKDKLVNKKLEAMNKSVVLGEGNTIVAAPYDGKLIDMPPALLQNYIFALTSGDRAMLTYAKNSTTTLTNSYSSWLPENFNQFSESQKIDFYKEKLAFGFSLMKSSMLDKPSSDKLCADYIKLCQSGDYVWEKR